MIVSALTVWVCVRNTADALAQSDGWTGHAVVVGIADYKGSDNDLFFCDEDAEEIAGSLLADGEHWPTPSNVELILDTDATVDGISSAVEAMRLATQGTEDVCLFYFSGHGRQVTDVPPIDETGPGGDGMDETLAVYDGHIYDDDLSAWLAGFTTQRVCVIIDSCHAGGMSKSVEGGSAAEWLSGMADDIARIAAPGATRSFVPGAVGTTTVSARPGAVGTQVASARPGAVGTQVASARPGAKDLGDLVSVPVNIVALMACEDAQASNEDFILANGVFTFFVIEAMNRLATDTNADTFSSAEEIFAYAAPRAESWNPSQTPCLLDGDPDELSQLPVLRAADGNVERIVTEEDLPFGGGIARGCAQPAPGPRSRAALLFPAALAAALWVGLSRRRAAGAAVAATSVVLLGACGCRRHDLRPLAYHSYAPDEGEDVPGGTGPVEAEGTGAGTETEPGLDRGEASPVQAPSLLPLPPRQGGERGPAFGVRAGALVPLGAKNATYAETVQAGIFVAARLWDVPFEIGIDACRLRSLDVDVAAYVVTGRVDVLKVRGLTLEGRETFYHLGPRVLVDFVETDTYWNGTSEVATALGAGIGIGRPGGGWDARVSVDWLLGSYNVAALLSLSAGATF